MHLGSDIHVLLDLCVLLEEGEAPEDLVLVRLVSSLLMLLTVAKRVMDVLKEALTNLIGVS